MRSSYKGRSVLKEKGRDAPFIISQTDFRRNKPTNAIFHHFSADSPKKVVETMNFRLFALSQTLFSVTIKTRKQPDRQKALKQVTGFES